MNGIQWEKNVLLAINCELGLYCMARIGIALCSSAQCLLIAFIELLQCDERWVFINLRFLQLRFFEIKQRAINAIINRAADVMAVASVQIYRYTVVLFYMQRVCFMVNM